MRYLVILLLVLPSVHLRAMPLAVKIVACESAGKHWSGAFRMNCNRHEPMGGKSCGIAQFQVRSFNWMAHKAGMELKYWNPEDQLTLLNWAIDHGYAKHWTCYRKIRRGTWKMTPELVRRMRRNVYIQTFYGEIK